MNNYDQQHTNQRDGTAGEKRKVLKVGSFNIRGAVTAGKAEALMEWASLESMDIIGIQETNLTRGARIGINRKHHEDYVSWWANGEEGATQGTGVGLLISKWWNNHSGKKAVFGSRAMAQEFNFHHGLKLVVINCYVPSGRANGEEAEKILGWVKSIYEKARQEEREVIVLGDFNGVMNPLADRKQQPGMNRGAQPETSLLRWVRLQPLHDSFRALHPIERAFTFGNASRLDMIFVGDRLATRLLRARHKDMLDIVASDHAMVVVTINIHGLVNGLSISTTTKPKGFRFQFKDTTDEQWEAFKSATEAQLMELDSDKMVGLQPFQSSEENVSKASFSKLEVELAWNRFSKVVYKEAKETLPGKIVGGIGNKPEEEVSLKYVVRAAAAAYKQATKIIKTDYAWRRTAEVEHLEKAQVHFNKMREHLNELNPEQELVDELEKPPNVQAEEEAWHQWRSGVRKQWRESLGALQILRKVESNKAIKEAIATRNELMTTETGKVLDSILGRGSGKVVLDRIQVEEDGDTFNEMDPTKVKAKVVEWFRQWYRPRPAKPLEEARWREQYAPCKDVDEEWYAGLMEAPTREEFDEAVKTAPKMKAPGLSGITNDILQHLGEVGKFILYQMVGAAIVQGEFPKAWKTGLIFCIPKTSEWTGNMAEIRPITLLEHARKIMFSILTTRLSTIMNTHNILRGPNFSVLKGTTTKDPIHIIQALMEDARESKREQWIVFQDMRRCFDSVNCGRDGMLSRALARLKVPDQFIRLCETISETKVNRVITDFGATEEFQPSCGLDQGGVECPLLWRIAYDPLLCEVMDTCEGYRIRGPSGTPSIAGVAFVDDTTWVARNKNAIQHTLDVATEFFDLNGIEINAKKTQVITINNKRPRTDSALQFGTPVEEIYPVGKKEAVRMLGVWVNSAGSPKPTTDLIKNETTTTCMILRRKAVTDRQTTYIVNSVLVNRIIYRISAQIIPKTTLKQLTGQYMAVCKAKAHLPSTTPNSIMAHHRFYSVKQLTDAQAEEQISGLWLRLNDSGMVGKICRARLLQLQQQLRLDVSPTRVPNDVKRTRQSFISGVCELMAERDIQFDVHMAEDFELAPNAATMIEWFGEDLDEEVVTECHDLGIYFIEQVLSVNQTELISWDELRQLVGKKRVSKDSPQWFLRLQTFCSSDRFALAFMTKWCQDRRAAMVEVDVEERERARQRVTYLSEVTDDPETEEEEGPGIQLPLPPPPPPLPLGAEEEAAAVQFVPSRELRHARRVGAVARPRLVETWKQRAARCKAYKEAYHRRVGGPKLRIQDDGENEFIRREQDADKEWRKQETSRLAKLAKLEKKERQLHEVAQQAARQAQAQRQEQARLKRIKALDRERKAAVKNKARQRQQSYKRRLQIVWQRRAERIKNVESSFRARISKIKKLRKRYIQPNGRINAGKLAQDARQALNRIGAPRERDLPRKDTLRDVYGLKLEGLTENTIQEQRSSLEGHGPLEFYSDGSLLEHGVSTGSMAFGVVAMRPGEERYSTIIAGKVKGYASSTKAELVGLLATILVCPRDTNATVFIDNEAVVTQFEAIVQKRQTATQRRRLRAPYAVWWAAIAKAFEHQGEKIDVQWVKGHSDSVGNNMADIAAKAGHTKDAWDMDPLVHTDMKCHAVFGGALVEDDLRQVLKKQSAARVHHKWANQGRTKAWIEAIDEVEWRTTLAIVHDRKNPRSLFTSTSDCSKRSHRIKKLHGMLPTRAYQHEWRPDLYEDSWCRVCEVSEEDTTHIWRCPETMESQREGWEEAMALVTNKGEQLWRRAKEKWRKDKKNALDKGEEFKREEPRFWVVSVEDFWAMLEKAFRGAKNIRAQNLLEDDLAKEEEEGEDLGALNWRKWTVVDAYHGLAPSRLTDKFKTLFGTSQAIASIMTDRFITLIEEYGRQGIWKPRCKKTVEWEKSVGITAVSKRARPEKPGTRAEGRGRSSSDYNSFDQNRFAVTRVKEIFKTADKRVLSTYLGTETLSVMERPGGVKYFLEKELGD